MTDREYFATSTPKDTIYLHHTAGSHRPDWVVDFWNTDRDKSGNRIRVATSYVIGGISTQNSDRKFDGVIYEAFDPKFWAHHLGIKAKNNTFLNQKSVAIEICNYGPLTQSRDGKFFTYVKSEVPETMVVKLDQPFRGFEFYHAYSDAQLESARKLIRHLSQEFDIDITKGLPKEISKKPGQIPDFKTIKDKQIWLNRNGFTDSLGKKLSEDGIEGLKTNQALEKALASPFDLDQSALAGFPGIWSHSNVRLDKTDIFPQKEMLQMLTGL